MFLTALLKIFDKKLKESGDCKLSWKNILEVAKYFKNKAKNKFIQVIKWTLLVVQRKQKKMVF